MFAERALSKRMPRLGWTVCWRSARCLFYLAAICIQGGGRRGRRGNIALQCIKQFFSLSLSLFPNRRPFPDSSSSIRSEISFPLVVGVILAAIRPVSWFMARDVSNSLFFFFLLLSSLKKNFYSFVRLFMAGSISTRSKKYEEIVSRELIRMQKREGYGYRRDTWDIFIDRREWIKISPDV